MHYTRVWESAFKTKITEEQNERTYVSHESVRGSGMKTTLKGDERMYGRNMKKPLKVASEKDGGETVSTDVFKEMPDAVTKTHFEERFVGRKIGKSFETDDVKKKRTVRSFEEKVKSYNEKRQLFCV